MRSVINRLYSPDYFGSGSTNSREFIEFFHDFKKAFTRQLKKLNAKEIQFSIGHFYLSGFFKVDEQYYYFSMSDVRHGYNFSRAGQPELLIRTAEHPKDYRGGSNNYVAIEEGMYKAIARTFRIEVPQSASKGKKSVKEMAQEIIEKGYADIYVGSAKKANYIAWRIDDILKPKDRGNTAIGVKTYGRRIASTNCETEEFSFYYSGDSKRAIYHVYEKEISDDEFIKSLKLDVRDKGEVVANMFVPEQKVFLEPEAVALHDFIKGAELTRHPFFDRALEIFRKRYSEAYMALLD